MLEYPPPHPSHRETDATVEQTFRPLCLAALSCLSAASINPVAVHAPPIFIVAIPTRACKTVAEGLDNLCVFTELVSVLVQIVLGVLSVSVHLRRTRLFHFPLRPCQRHKPARLDRQYRAR